LNSKTFRPTAWVNHAQSRPDIINSLENTGAVQSGQERKFSLQNFLVPGWKGDGLFTKQALLIKQCYQILLTDAHQKFKTFNNTNKSLKLAVYNDFLMYVNGQNLKCYDIDSFTTFWSNISDEKSPYRKELDDFVTEFCFRAVNIYLFRLKFVIAIGNATAIDVSISNLLNPTSFITKIFPKGGGRELYCEALQTNQYSWYRPEAKLDDTIIKLSSMLPTLSITEIIKLSTPVTNTEHKTEGESDQLEYSHSISHKSFGAFVNELLLFFPAWLHKRNSENKSEHHASANSPSILNCKFTGNSLTSFILSHWLAQEEEIHKIWKEIICPDFINDDACNGQYVKLCHELQFLEYLVKIAQHQNHPPIDFVCEVINEKYRAFYDDPNGQTWMFSSPEAKRNIFYSRIVLNLAQLPAKNPHHFLLTQISNQKKWLTSNGLIYVFSNQKLFIPSHSDKVDSFLKEIKIEAFFSFEGLKGKGEIPNYLYVFSNRPSDATLSLNIGIVPQLEIIKENCYHFKISGELPIFQNFASAVTEFQTFLNSKNPITTSIYQKELEKELLFEFYQDAIVKGKLLHSSSNDPHKITHPQFFKNLTKQCCPLDNFFLIDSIYSSEYGSKDRHLMASSFLGASIQMEERFPVVLIVNRSDATNIKVEIISSEGYNGAVEKYGVALYHYFGLRPKQKDLNINIFREFFNSNIGSQIIQLTLGDSVTKLKSKLNAMLVPKFLGASEKIPPHLEDSLSFLKSSLPQLLATDPAVLKENFTTISPQIAQLTTNFPAHIMGLISYFKVNLKDCLAHFDKKQKYANYNNPAIITPLIKLKSHPIFPSHSDIFIKFLPEGAKLINSLLSETAVKQDGEENNYLEIYAEGVAVVQLHTGPVMINFLNFILKSATGRPLSTILQGLQAPALADLERLLDNFNQLSATLQNIHEQIEAIISSIFIKAISSNINS